MADDTQSSSSSVSAFVSALILNGIIALVFVLIFIAFKGKFKRVYQPRSTVDTVPDDLKADPQPKGVFSWIGFILSKPESYIIEKTGVDGYFFLRYLLTFGSIGIIGGLFLWPVLFAVDATGGGDAQGFDIISYSNVTGKWKVLAHVFCSWLYFSLIIYTIYKELIYYTSFRHALQVSPKYSSLQSSKTLMLDNVPDDLLNEESLIRLFPAAENMWFTRKTTDLQKVIKKRNKLSGKLEGGLNKVLAKCIKIRAKCIKKDLPVPEPANELVSYIPDKKLPTYKKYPIPIFVKGKKLFTEGVDEIGEYNSEISSEQANYPDGFEKTGSVFIEFINHLELQRAYQAVPYSKELKLSRRITSVAPEDIIWENTGLTFAERTVKRAIAITILTLTIIFWSIPVAAVGAISNINYLIDKLPWLSFINNMPSVLLGIITALLPTIALAVLMSLLPPFIRKIGKISGCMTVQAVERWTQQWYFAFQVVQVFLVVTLASAAASTVTDIINDPGSAMDLLGQKLPPASNFYISYMLLQGLSISSGALAQIVGLILSFIMGRVLDKTPRQKWNRYNNLSSPAWGTTYGAYGFFTVIMCTYSIISPIIIAFTSIAFFLIYIAYLYNLNYVMNHTYDSRGRNYPLALFEVFVGIYLAELCLIALFVMPKNWTAVALEAVMLAVTIAAHLFLNWRFEPILDTVPVGAVKEADGGLVGAYPMNDQGYKQIKEEGESYFSGDGAGSSDSQEMSSLNGDNQTATGGAHTGAKSGSPFTDDAAITTDSKNTHQKNNSTVNNQSLLSDSNSVGDLENNATLDNEDVPFKSDSEKSGAIGAAGTSGAVDNSGKRFNPAEYARPSYIKGFVDRFFKPRTFLSFNYARSIMPRSFDEPVIVDKSEASSGFNDPAINEKEPLLWIPRDSVGLSATMLNFTDGKVKVSDEHAIMDDTGKAEYTGLPPDYEPPVKG